MSYLSDFVGSISKTTLGNTEIPIILGAGGMHVAEEAKVELLIKQQSNRGVAIASLFRDANRFLTRNYYMFTAQSKAQHSVSIQLQLGILSRNSYVQYV